MSASACTRSMPGLSKLTVKRGELHITKDYIGLSRKRLYCHDIAAPPDVGPTNFTQLTVLSFITLHIIASL